MLYAAGATVVVSGGRVKMSSTLLTHFNRIVYDRLTAWSSISSESPVRVHEEKIYEWDDTHYLLQRTPEAAVLLSLAMPQLQNSFEIVEALAKAYKGVATVVAPQPGYNVTLNVNIRMLARVTPHQQDYWIKELAALRLTVMGTPLRQHFDRLIQGTSVPRPTEAHCSRPGQAFFIQPTQDAVHVIFPVRFSSSFDAAIGKAFLQEFVEARKMAVLGKSPACTYSQEAPDAVLEGGPDALTGVNGGYISFILTKRHVDGPQVSHVLWSMCSFYFLISCHLKACKAAMHSKMRSSMNRMCQTLQAVQPDWQQEHDVGATEI